MRYFELGTHFQELPLLNMQMPNYKCCMLAICKLCPCHIVGAAGNFQFAGHPYTSPYILPYTEMFSVYDSVYRHLFRTQFRTITFILASNLHAQIYCEHSSVYGSVCTYTYGYSLYYVVYRIYVCAFAQTYSLHKCVCKSIFDMRFRMLNYIAVILEPKKTCQMQHLQELKVSGGNKNDCGTHYCRGYPQCCWKSATILP